MLQIAPPYWGGGWRNAVEVATFAATGTARLAALERRADNFAHAIVEFPQASFHRQLVGTLVIVAAIPEQLPSPLQSLRGKLIFAGDFIQDGIRGVDEIAPLGGDLSLEEILRAEPGASR